MDKKTLVINGNDFNTLETFYYEVDKVLTFNLNWKTGHNFNALNDLLRGGIGVCDYEESFKLTWLYFSKSKKRLGDKLVAELVDIITGHSHIEFITED